MRRFRRSRFHRRRHGIRKRYSGSRYRRFRRGFNGRVAGLQLGKSEWKARTDNFSINCTNADGPALLLNGMQRGTDIYQRVAQKVVMRSVSIKADLTCDTGASSGSVARIALVYDKQTNGAAVNASDVFDDGVTDLDIAPVKLENRARFLILREKRISVSFTGGIDNKPVTIIWKGMLPVVYNSGDAGTVGDINSGGLFLVVVGNSGILTPTALKGSYRVRFVDN